METPILYTFLQGWGKNVAHWSVNNWGRWTDTGQFLALLYNYNKQKF